MSDTNVENFNQTTTVPVKLMEIQFREFKIQAFKTDNKTDYYGSKLFEIKFFKKFVVVGDLL
jgi:hypothetical protein